MTVTECNSNGQFKTGIAQRLLLGGPEVHSFNFVSVRAFLNSSISFMYWYLLICADYVFFSKNSRYNDRYMYMVASLANISKGRSWLGRWPCVYVYICVYIYIYYICTSAILKQWNLALMAVKEKDLTGRSNENRTLHAGAEFLSRPQLFGMSCWCSFTCHKIWRCSPF